MCCSLFMKYYTRFSTVDTRVKESEEATSNEELSQVSPKEDSELIVRLPLLATDIVKVNENVKALSSDEDSESATEHAYLREKLDDSLSIDNVELKLTVGAALGVEDPGKLTVTLFFHLYSIIVLRYEFLSGYMLQKCMKTFRLVLWNVPTQIELL